MEVLHYIPKVHAVVASTISVQWANMQAGFTVLPSETCVKLIAAILAGLLRTSLPTFKGSSDNQTVMGEVS